jgi:hypothetical protein
MEAVKKPDEDKLSQSFLVRMTQKEREQLRALAMKKHMSESGLIRELLRREWEGNYGNQTH